MRTKRIIAILMTVMLLAGNLVWFTGTVRAAAEPEIIISGVNVTEDGTAGGKATGYLEVSVAVQAAGFQTVGVVLSYDTEVLTPVDWKDPANAPGLTTNWTTVIPTKGADDFSGKPALARLAEAEEPAPEEAPAKRGYLYLGAESLQYQDLSAEATRLVTVRFAIEKDDSGNYLQVTVPGAGDVLTDDSKTLCLAPEADAEAAIPGAQVQLTLGEPVEETEGSELNPLDGHVLKYYAWRTTESKYEVNKETACKVSFRTGPGATINTGTAGPVSGGDYAITFFDWDGRVIDAVSADDDNAEAVVDTWEKAHSDRLGNKPGYEFNGWLVVYQANDGSGLQTRYKSLTSVKAAESTPVAYDTTPSAVNNAKLYTQDMFSNYKDLSSITTKNFEDLDNAMAGSETAVLLQATYKATETVNNGTGETADLGGSRTFYQYGTPTYYQYGPADVSNGQYGITIPLTRGDVLRANLPAIQAQVYVNVNGKTEIVIVKVDLENTDETSFEVVVPKSATQVSLRLRDTYNASDWTNAQGRSSEIFVMNGDFVKGGALAALIEESWQVAKAGGTWSNTVNAQCFADAGCPVNSVDNAKAALVAKVNAEGRRLMESEVAAAVSGK